MKQKKKKIFQLIIVFLAIQGSFFTNFISADPVQDALQFIGDTGSVLNNWQCENGYKISIDPVIRAMPYERYAQVYCGFPANDIKGGILDGPTGEPSVQPDRGLPGGGFRLPCPDDFGEIGKIVSTRKYVLNVINFVLGFLGILCVVIIIYAGFMYVTDGGGESGKEKAKKTLMWVFVGVIVILGSYAIVNTLLKNVAVGGQDRDGNQISGSNNVEGNYSEYNLNDFEPGGSYSHCATTYKKQTEAASKNFQLNDSVVIKADDRVIEKKYTRFSFIKNLQYKKLSFSLEEAQVKALEQATGSNWKLVQGSLFQTNSIDNKEDSSSKRKVDVPQVNWSLRELSSNKKLDEATLDIDKPFDILFQLKKGFFRITAQVPGQGLQTRTFYMGNPIEAILYATNKEGTEADFVLKGEKIFFNGKDSSILEGLGALQSYTWSFSENSGITYVDGDLKSDSFIATFSEVGNYKVALTVTARGVGNTASDTFDFKVVSGDVSSLSQSKKINTLNLYVQETNLVEGVDIPFHSSITPLQSAYYKWFIDGKVLNEGQDLTKISHKFPESGFVNITLQVFTNAEESGDPDNILKEKSLQRYIKNLDIKDVAIEFSQNWGGSIPEKIRQGFRSILDLFIIRESGTASIDTFIGNTVEKIGILFSRGEKGEAPKKIDESSGTWYVDGKIVGNANSGNSDQSIKNYLNEKLKSKGDFKKGLHIVKYVGLLEGKKASRSFSLNVKNLPPVINSIEKTEIKDGDIWKISAKKSEDKDGEIVQYRFSLMEYGKILESQSSPSPEVYFTVFQYKKAKKEDLEVQVIVVDDAGETSKQTKKFSLFQSGQGTDKGSGLEKTDSGGGSKISGLENTAPTGKIIFRPSNIGDTDTLFQFHGEGNDVDKDVLTYKWQINNTGSFIYGRSFNKRFLKPGDYEIKLSISDGEKTTDYSDKITVIGEDRSKGNNRPPIVSLAGMTPGSIGYQSTLFGFYIRAEDPEKDSLTYKWDMGDGTTYSIKNVLHKYQGIGSYTAQVIVSDGNKESKLSIPVRILKQDQVLGKSTVPVYKEKTNKNFNEIFNKESVKILSNKNFNKISNKESVKILSRFKDIAIEGTTNSIFFLYANTPKSEEKAVFFEWSLGDGRKIFGQNISVRYPKAGKYDVKLMVSDGESQVFDTITILIKKAS